MIVNKDREKLIAAIIFFAQNTQNCSKTKLFKLLFLLDFEHFKAAGRTVTGNDYFALPRGPVPLALHNEFDLEESQADFESSVDIETQDFFGHKRLLVKPKKNFDASIFTKREIQLLSQIATSYRTQTAKEMVDVTHAENGAWDKVYRGGSGIGVKIPYNLAFENQVEAESVEALQKERSEFLNQFGSDRYQLAA
jgi:uncharacterized phage-associated protein